MKNPFWVNTAKTTSESINFKVCLTLIERKDRSNPYLEFSWNFPFSKPQTEIIIWYFESVLPALVALS